MAPFAETPILSWHPDTTFEVSKEPDIRDEWWTSEELLSLERRAIFSKAWVCICHRSRFVKSGDYISLELAGYPILVILGKDSIVRAFHNVCRHRAYTITQKPAGSSLVLGCRYHGWSYDTKGNLVKAPQFNGIEGFDKTENGLFKIRTCTDRAGFVHVNLDAGDECGAPDCERLVNFAAEHGISTSSKWLTGWELGGGFNWKTVGASDRTGIGTAGFSTGKASVMERIVSMFGRARLDVSGSRVLKLEPSTLVFVFPQSHVWAICTTLPLSVARCNVKCDIYTKKEAALDDTDVEILRDYFAVEVQGLEQCYDAIKTTSMEGEPLILPLILPLIKAHKNLERTLGREVYPGRKQNGKSESFCKAEKLCNELDQIAKVGTLGGAIRVDRIQGTLDW